MSSITIGMAGELYGLELVKNRKIIDSYEQYLVGKIDIKSLQKILQTENLSIIQAEELRNKKIKEQIRREKINTLLTDFTKKIRGFFCKEIEK